MKITPLILGSGNAGQAAAKSLACLSIASPEFEIAPPVWVSRGAELGPLSANHENAVLVIANPHALHCGLIIEGAKAGFKALVCEKPSCVNERELVGLKDVRTPVGILHVYRQTWGVQTLKAMIESGEIGDLISIEGRLWQSSAAERAHVGGPPKKAWKNDISLSGPFDAFIDIGVHWVDTASFLAGQSLRNVSGWRSYANAEAPHRDTLVHLNLEFDRGCRGLVSISKNVHGANNFFEIIVLGSKKTLTWVFGRPDEITVGEGRDSRVITRKDTTTGSMQPPFHGMGWLEGYIEIFRQVLGEVFLGRPGHYPRLQENLRMMEKLFQVKW